MTEETLKRANELNNKLKALRTALDKLEEPNGRVEIRFRERTELPKSFKEPIKVLVKNEIIRLEKELADL